MSANVDANMRFDSFVVGPENRVAWEAARTAAESPGAAYNPLFIYSDTGLGKTHLLAAIANRAAELHANVTVVYSPVERLLRELDGDSEAGYREADILLVDDLQFLGGQRGNHERLFHVLDHLLLAGKQVALACDRPPLEMGELDDRLLSRFSGGLVVDIGRPNLETRRAILERRLSELGVSLGSAVLDAIARVAIENVRQLQGALHRVLVTQKVEEREIEPEEVDRLLKDVVADPDVPWLSEEGAWTENEFGEFLTDVSSAVEEALGSPGWREDLARAIMKWESEGYSTARLEEQLESDDPIDADALIDEYERDVAELRATAQQLERLDAQPEQESLLRDPDRLPQLRKMLEEARREGMEIDEFFLDREKVVWDWPVLEERLIEAWDDGDKG